MKNLNVLNESRKSIGIFSGLMLLFFLLMNSLTPYVADDYAYMYSFYDAERVESIIDVIKSAYMHCFVVNGRVVPHALEQFFLTMPKAVFNLCNAAAAVIVIYLLYRAANFGKKRNLLLYAAIGMAFWYFVPEFGQVFLWQVGALNYGWGVLGMILFLIPFIYRYIYEKDILSAWQKAVFLSLSLVFGMYAEIPSFIGILLAGAFLIMMKKRKAYLIAAEAIAILGYVILLKMPAEIGAKGLEMTVANLAAQLAAVSETIRSHLLPLLLVWVILFAISLHKKIEVKRLRLSVLFMLGGLAAGFMLTAASYIAERCLCTSAVLLILSCGVLFAGQTEDVVVCVSAVGMLAAGFTFSFISGAYDIWNTYTAFEAREEALAQAIENGEKNLVLQCVHPKTKYSAFWGITDLNTASTNEYPNVPMAMYYNVESILGN